MALPNHYRFLPKGQDKEQVGEGKVFEKYKVVRSFLIFNQVEDDGGKGLIEAGPISLKWSHHDRGSGWIYVDDPTQTKVLAADAKYFPRIDLKTLMK